MPPNETSSLLSSPSSLYRRGQCAWRCWRAGSRGVLGVDGESAVVISMLFVVIISSFSEVVGVVVAAFLAWTAFYAWMVRALSYRVVSSSPPRPSSTVGVLGGALACSQVVGIVASGGVRCLRRVGGRHGYVVIVGKGSSAFGIVCHRSHPRW